MNDQQLSELVAKQEQLWQAHKTVEVEYKRTLDEWLIVYRRMEHEKAKRALLAEIQSENVAVATANASAHDAIERTK